VGFVADFFMPLSDSLVRGILSKLAGE